MDPEGAKLGEQSSRTRRVFIPRVSLLSFLLLAALICVSISHLRLSSENKDLRTRNDELMEQDGGLIIHDPNKIYFRRLESLDDLTWRFQIYLPPERNYWLYARTGNSWSSSHIENQKADQIRLTVGLRRHNLNGTWEIRVVGPLTALSSTADARVAEVIREGVAFLPAFRGEQQELDPDQPFDLLRALDGAFHIWIDTQSGVPPPYAPLKLPENPVE